MWGVSARFLLSLTQAPRYVTVATFTVPGGTPVPVRVEGGTITVDSGQNIRRQCDLTVLGGTAVYEPLMMPGTILHIDHGLNLGTTELVPVFHGEITDGNQNLGANSIELTGGDPFVRVARSAFTSPYNPPANTRRTQVIANIITSTVPGTIVTDLSTDVGVIGPGLTWTGDPTEVITDLTKDGGTEAFFLPDGTFMIRNRPVLDTSPVWVSRTWTSAGRERPMDRLYNMVVVNPAATDGTQKWVQQVVAITDPAHPRHPSKIGDVPYILDNSTARTAAEAANAGRVILNRVLGTSETLNLTGLANPALEGSDVITAIIPATGTAKPQAFQHFIDSYNYDLATADMTLKTRTTQVGDDA